MDVDQLDQQLVDAEEIATRLDLSHYQNVHTWARRHDRFPKPVIDRDRARLWYWPDVEAWAISTGRLTAEGEPIKRAGGRTRDDD